MANNTQDTANLIRQAKYEGFIRHTSATNNDAKTAARFDKYAQQDRLREEKFVGLRNNILEGLKA
jgi:hypothetical protein